jgi:hypothetical protein
MNKREFLSLLGHASNAALDFAKVYVLDELPLDYKYNVSLSLSTDDPRLTQFDIYPEDRGKVAGLLEDTEVVELLCRKEKVPVWIDISVHSLDKGCTVIQLLCAGRYSADVATFYYPDNGMPPFGIKSPAFPAGYKTGEKFRLKPA